MGGDIKTTCMARGWRRFLLLFPITLFGRVHGLTRLSRTTTLSALAMIYSGEQKVFTPFLPLGLTIGIGIKPIGDTVETLPLEQV
jgi:hypothetical protein